MSVLLGRRTISCAEYNVHDLALLLNAKELHCDEVGQPADGVAKEGDAS
jgi:hypothetical protein